MNDDDRDDEHDDDDPFRGPCEISPNGNLILDGRVPVEAVIAEQSCYDAQHAMVWVKLPFGPDRVECCVVCSMALAHALLQGLSEDHARRFVNAIRYDDPRNDSPPSDPTS